MPVSSVQVTGDLLASVINNSYKYKPEWGLGAQQMAAELPNHHQAI